MRILLSHGLASSQVVFLQYYCFLLVAKSGDSLKKQTEKTDRVNSFLKKKINFRHAGIKSKIYQSKIYWNISM